MADTHLKIAPIGEGLSLKARAYDALKTAILNMNIYVRDASSGAAVTAMSADMRGNTDESWSRTLDWLIRNRLLAPGYGARQ